MTFEELAYEVLRSLASDVRAVGVDHVKQDWPDLYQTYIQACEALVTHKREVASCR